MENEERRRQLERLAGPEDEAEDVKPIVMHDSGHASPITGAAVKKEVKEEFDDGMDFSDFGDGGEGERLSRTYLGW